MLWYNSTHEVLLLYTFSGRRTSLLESIAQNIWYESVKFFTSSIQASEQRIQKREGVGGGGGGFGWSVTLGTDVKPSPRTQMTRIQCQPRESVLCFSLW